MNDTFGTLLNRLRTRHKLSCAQLGAKINYTGAYVWDLEHGRRAAGPDIAAALDEALAADGALLALAGPQPGADPTEDEIDAYELAQRAEATDVSGATLTGLERAFDRLAIAYQGTPPDRLLPDTRRYLRYIGQLVDGRATLTQRRRMLRAGGWLSLLAATLHIDLHQRGAADARLAAAVALAEHAGDDEIAAWCLETRAWDALTEGRYRLAVDLSQAAQDVAPKAGSAFIQATAQEGRAHARLGEDRETRGALDRVARLASPLPVPDEPEHHYRYDPAKQVAYTATTLSWLGDPAAVDYAREVVDRLRTGVDGGRRPRREASARIDLALALVAAGRPDEAVGEGLAAITSGRIVPSNAWRAAEVVAGVEAAGLPEAVELREAYRTLIPA
jgi:transcriptional regulator with XRE-family HTH domain